MNKYTMRQSALLILAAIVWGISFVAQSEGMNYIGTFTFNGIRCTMGAVVLIPVILIIRKMEQRKPGADPDSLYIKVFNKPLIIGSVICGFILYAAVNLQTVALETCTSGKAGFMTAMYIIIVPILGLFIRKRVGIKLWIGVALAMLGMYLLCITDNSGLQKEDYYLLGCSFIFSLHILTVDYFSPKTNGVAFSSLQFFICGLLSLISMVIWETPDMRSIYACIGALLYSGIMSSGVGYTLQIVGQKGLNPTVASLCMSLESVFSLLAGLVILGELMSLRETIGCVLMFIAIVLAQLPDKKQVATS